ncbi:hypothetical protein KFK09_006477 [Dendrobium nobile]|uniref:Uncharacterized protein n=1 Tax=Dendrobium nobile TaxID=94219 RepID=A0A8T3BTM4_DENNO|nr:hypothetical protein KFK09_006477 [Dendrobium nobile]
MKPSGTTLSRLFLSALSTSSPPEPKQPLKEAPLPDAPSDLLLRLYRPQAERERERERFPLTFLSLQSNPPPSFLFRSEVTTF